MLLLNYAWGIFLDYFPNSVKAVILKRTYVELVVLPNKVPVVLKVLKKWSSMKFTSLIDIVAIDFLKTQKSRFRIVYVLRNSKTGLNCLVHTSLMNIFSISSIVSIYKNANWSEREIFDLYGIQFIGHPRLTRILTDYGFIGHPLRKDFPLIGPINGKTVVRKGDTTWVLRGLPDAEDE